MNLLKIGLSGIVSLLALSSIPAAANGGWELTNEPAHNRFAEYAGRPGSEVLPGDFNGDGLSDFAIIRRGWKTIPTAFSDGIGGWKTFNNPVNSFNGGSWENGRSTVIAADFNGNGRTDIALLRHDSHRIPIAFSDGVGGWEMTDGPTTYSWGRWAAHTRLDVHTGDFNGDGRADIALLRDGWSSIPVALSDGIGGWTIVNEPAGDFVGWATFSSTQDRIRSGQKFFSSDFNGDGRTDFAAVRPGWPTIPIAFSNGSGGWDVTNKPINGQWVSGTSSFVAGDFNGNGRTDVAFVQQGKTTVPVAFSDGSGGWAFSNWSVDRRWTPDSKTRAHTGDFDLDGRTDIALVRPGWSTIPVAYSSGGGRWGFTNGHVADSWGGWVDTKGVSVATGAFDYDPRPDIALVRVGRSGWGTMPVAFSRKVELAVPPDIYSLLPRPPATGGELRPYIDGGSDIKNYR